MLGVLIQRVVGAVIIALMLLGCGCAEIANKTQPPVQVTTSPFLILSGYYVNVLNVSPSTTLTGVVVTYTGASGNKVSQQIGTLRPGETRTLDPSELSWTVEKHEKITVAADGYLPKTLETNVIIK